MKSIQIKQSITNRSGDISLNNYLKDIAKIKMLTPEQEKEIAKQAKEGNKQAREKLINANLRFVVSVAKQYQGQGLDLMDLIQAGNYGMIKAAEKFDVDRGFRFISYAVWWIRQSITQSLSDLSRTIRLPLSQIHSASKIKKAIAKFESLNERKPSEEELEDLIDLPIDKIEKYLNAEAKIISVDTPFPEEEGTILDVIPNTNIERTDGEVLKDSISNTIKRYLNKLPEREHDILLMYFGLGCEQQTLENIGEKFGITYERARQLRDKALDTLRKTNLYKEV